MKQNILSPAFVLYVCWHLFARLTQIIRALLIVISVDVHPAHFFCWISVLDFFWSFLDISVWAFLSGAMSPVEAKRGRFVILNYDNLLCAMTFPHSSFMRVLHRKIRRRGSEKSTGNMEKRVRAGVDGLVKAGFLCLISFVSISSYVSPSINAVSRVPLLCFSDRNCSCSNRNEFMRTLIFKMGLGGGGWPLHTGPETC